MKQVKVVFLALLAFFLLAGVALAQRGVPVTEKPRPDYDAQGIRSGGMVIKPELTLGLEYNDNIYATKDNKESDWITIIAPRIKVDSNWTRHALGFDAGLKGGIYASESDENYLDAHIRLSGRMDVLRESFFSALASFERLHEERGERDVSGTWKEPSVYNRSMGNLSYLHGIGKVSLNAGVGITNLDYQSVDLIGGGSDSQDLRDRNIYNVNARMAYELLPNVLPFLAAQYEWRKYDKSEARRDSDGYRIGVGTGFDLGGVTTGEIFAGYMHQDYDHRDNISGAWYGLSLLWNVTEMTSVQASVESSVKETTVANAAGINAVDAGIRIDHELLRNLLVGAFFDYTYDDYKSVDITDKYYTVGPRVTYLWNRNLSLGAEYSHKKKDSTPSTRDYTENKFMISLTGKF